MLASFTFCCGEKSIFVNFNTDFKISLCSTALFFRNGVGQSRGYRLALSDFKNWLLSRRKYNFIEFKVRLIANRSLFLITQY